MRPLILCDDSEERSSIPQMLAASGCSVRVERLEAGDYLLSAALAVERKAERDVVDSICSGRLQEQLQRMSATHEQGILLIEGDTWKGDLRLKTPMLGAIYHEITFISNLTCLYSPDAKYSARLMKDLALREQFGKLVPRPVARPVVRNAREPIDFLRSFPGVGTARATKLLDSFGSVRAVVNATEVELRAALGAKIGAQMYGLLG